MPYCYCPGCSHLSRRETCRFYRFPANKKDFTAWKKMCRRADRDPTQEDRLCSCHFVDGSKAAGPTIFPWNKGGQWQFPAPEKSRRKTIKAADVETPDVVTATPDAATTPSEAGPPTPTVLPFMSPALDSAEMYFLKEENQQLKSQLQKGEGRLSFKEISAMNSLVFQYTGLPSSAHFLVLNSLLMRFTLNYFNGWNVEVINHEDQLLCTLMKLRLNLFNFDLAFRFKISTATVHNIVLTYIYAIHEVLFLGMMNKVPSKEKNYLFLPTCFRDFPNCKMVLDCTEIEVAIPSTLKLKKVTFSHYKQRHTFKVLIGVAPNATITFVSDLFPGSTSDKQITKESCVLHNMIAGDLILADKGFLISDMCRELGVTVNIPPFLSQPQFTVPEALATRKIARARIHVERANCRLKNFRILDFIMPEMREHSSIIVQTCAALVNLQYSLLKENEQCFESFMDD